MARQPLRVMYVDDEADIRTIVEFALEDEADIVLQLCGSGQQALEQLSGFKPDLILMDVMMPGLDGPSTLQRLQQQPDAAPTVFVTAKVQPHEIEQFKAMGAMDVLGKPFDPMRLADYVRQLGNRLP